MCCGDMESVLVIENDRDTLDGTVFSSGDVQISASGT